MKSGAAAAQAATSAATPLRVLVASHSHPELTNGGSEIAAFQLYRALQARPDCRTWLLGCDRSTAADRPGAVLSQPYSATEYLYRTNQFDWFKFANLDPGFPSEIERLLRELAPDVVHFHHYINFGVEVFQHVRRVLPDCRIVLTLHEYLAICHHYGQMVTKPHHHLCQQSSEARCHKCFSDFAPSDFFLRKRYIDRFFDLVDTFIAPSQFLADRYVDWGVPAAKLVVLENLMPPAEAAPAAQIPSKGTLRIGYFGQISSLKGIDLLLDTAAALEADGVTDVSFEIFGDYLGQPEELRAGFQARLGGTGRNVRFNGPYDRREVNRLMQSVHAVLVPSLWWENSPLVIQEALRNRRPVICSDIGGMAEKVRDGLDGFHFAAGNIMALTSLLRGLAGNRKPLAEVAARLSGRPAQEADIDDFIGIYRGIYRGICRGTNRRGVRPGRSPGGKTPGTGKGAVAVTDPNLARRLRSSLRRPT
jgi:glycosyltransferase involved in cell wall biosynthesis